MSDIRYVVAGHFGTTLSYATIAKNVAMGFARRGMLAGTINFDDAYVGFDRVQASNEDMAMARLLCVTLPGHHVEQLAEYVGQARSILYMSPNTDDLSEETRRVSWAFGGIVTPSQFCEHTVLRCTGRVSPRVPLGVAPEFLDAFDATTAALRERVAEPPRFLHMSTDGFLPGRKGTDVLLDAITLARHRLPPGSRFTLHVLPGIQFDVRTYCNDRELDDIVEVVAGKSRGLSDAELVTLVAAHDVVVQPSRCEGFGITQLLPLVMGVPLVTTHSTGMTDFLGSFPGCWMPIRHSAMATLDGEDGNAPQVSPGEVADLLVLAASRTMRESMLKYQGLVPSATRQSWLWSECADAWIQALDNSLTHG